MESMGIDDCEDKDNDVCTVCGVVSAIGSTCCGAVVGPLCNTFGCTATTTSGRLCDPCYVKATCIECGRAGANEEEIADSHHCGDCARRLFCPNCNERLTADRSADLHGDGFAVVWSCGCGKVS